MQKNNRDESEFRESKYSRLVWSDKWTVLINKELNLVFIIYQQSQKMDFFEIPDDYKPEKPLTDEEADEITNYLNGHPLFLK